MDKIVNKKAGRSLLIYTIILLFYHIKRHIIIKAISRHPNEEVRSSSFDFRI
jgi:hypothetical protein